MSIHKIYEEPLWLCPSCQRKNQLSFKHCTECGARLPSTNAPESEMPSDGKPREMSRKVLYAIIGSSLALFLISTAIPKAKPKQPEVVNRLAATSAPDGMPVTIPTPRPTPAREDWQYLDYDDDMSGKTVKSAKVRSLNTVSFGFPYEGEQHATLTLRKHPRHGNDVILHIERGQFLAGVSGVQVLARFDDGDPVKFWAQGAEDNSTTVLFLGNFARFQALAQKSKSVRISTPVYQEGSPTFAFNVEGLKSF